jgi:WD40 repeat protein
VGFDGFISYSHAADGRLAPAVQRGLHSLAKPWHRRRALWIFRDQTGLAVTPALWSSIQHALDSSEWFVLMASSEAARSPWVNKEIEHWVATTPPDRILPVVTDGGWAWDAERGDFAADSTAVPAALRGIFVEEPLFLDLRWARQDGHLSLRHSRFRDAIAQLAAPMHGVSKDELEGEDVRQHRRARRLWSVAAAGLVVLTLVASLAGVLAVRNANRANTSAAEALRQQLRAAEQETNADRSAQEAGRQLKYAQEQGAQAKAALAETRRQEQRAQRQRDLADRASAEAARQQAYARSQREQAQRQQRIAERAAERARQQETLAQESAAETRRQKHIVHQQQRLSREAAAEARRQKAVAEEQQRLAAAATAGARQQEEAAREQQRLAAEATAEADRQKTAAEQQQRIAIGRRLTNQAKTLVSTDPKTALLLGTAAARIQDGDEARKQLTGLVTNTRYAGEFTSVSDAEFAAEDVLVVESEGSNDLGLWEVRDPAGPTLLGTLPFSEEDTGTWKVSPGAKTVVKLRADGRATLYDVSDRSHPAEKGSIPGSLDLEFSPDGRILAVGGSGDDDVVATLYDVADPAGPVLLSRISDPGNRYVGSLSAEGGLRFGAGGRLLAAATEEMTVWDLADPAAPVRHVAPGSGAVYSFAFSPTDPLLVLGGDGEVTAWDLTDPANPRRRGTLIDHDDLITSMKFSADGSTLATIDERGSPIVWAILNRFFLTRVASMPGRGPIEPAIRLSPNGRTLVTIDDFDTAALWNVASYGAPHMLSQLALGGTRPAAAFIGATRTIVVADTDGEAELWDLADPGKPVRRATARILDGPAPRVSLSPDGRFAAAAGSGGRVRVTDLADFAHPVTVAEFTEDIPRTIGDMSISADGRTLAIPASGEGKVLLWDLAERNHPTRLATVLGAKVPMDFSPDGRTLVASNGSEGVGLWDLTVRSSPRKWSDLVGHGQRVTSLAVGPDGKTVVSGSEDDTVMLWNVADPADPRRLATVAGGQTWMSTMAFTADGTTLATMSGGDQAMTVLDISETFDPIHLASVNLLAQKVRIGTSRSVFAPDGRTLALVGDGTVTLWDTSQLSALRADPAKQACAITGRGLTIQEWTRHVPDLEFRPTCPGPR